MTLSKDHESVASSPHGTELSNISFNKLLQVERPRFHSDGEHNMNLLKAIGKEAGNLEAPNSKEWFNDTAGWARGHSIATVSVSFRQWFLHPVPIESMSRRLVPRIFSYSADYPAQYARNV